MSVRVYKQGTSTYVIGTGDTQAALDAVGISPHTHRWGSTTFGKFVRRQGKWRSASDYMTPKDAVPGVCFVGRIVAAAIDEEATP
jgi:hypothetical protein